MNHVIVIAVFSYYLQVLSPNCPNYCPDTRSCKSPCEISCPTGERYSIATGSCVASGATPSVSTTHNVNSYKVKHVIVHQIATKGYNLIPKEVGESSINVTIGDIIGYQSIVGIIGVRPVGAGEGGHFKLADTSDPTSKTFTLPAAASEITLLRAIVSTPADITLFNMYSTTTTYATELTVTNVKRPTSQKVNA